MTIPATWQARVRHRYGWRLVAMPFLIVLTLVTVVLIAQSPVTPADGPDVATLEARAPLPGPVQGDPRQVAAGTPAVAAGVSAEREAASASASASAVEVAAGSVATQTQAAVSAPATDPAEVLTPNLAVGALPAGQPYTVAGDGTYRVVAGAGAPAGSSPTVVTYTVEIEDGVVTAEGDDEFARFVDRTLADPRSWITVKGVTLQRVDAAADVTPDFRVTLTSQQTVRDMCGFSVPLESSCYTRAAGRVFINDARWVRGSLTYGTDLNSYRQYAINHEVGHALGYGHQPCGQDRALAPVMMQQSWSTSNDALAGINGSTVADGKACLPNPWPEPAGAEGAATATTG
ncbi:MAG: DUF3152 domain-containing protein [Nakamurella sp.]